MRMISILIFCVISFLGCSEHSDPIGTYVLTTPTEKLTLEILQNGKYKLTFRKLAGGSGMIEGKWEKNEVLATSLSLHGVTWHGTQPEAGHSIWAATIDTGSKICLDAEGINCFVKEK